MAVDAGAVETITFDSFTTIVNVEKSTREVLAEYVDDPDPVATLWRFRAVDYRMVSAFTEYEDYERTTREALEYALAVHGHDLPDDAVDRIAGVFDRLAVYRDVRPGMERLVDRGYDLYVLSNGTPDLLDSMVERAGIDDLIEGTISADGVETFKPDPAIYEYAAARVDTPMDAIAHVATPWYDVYGAMHAGLQSVWLNRNGVPWDRFDGTPDLIVDDFDALTASFA